jgi:hypothetical protein
MLRKLAEDVPLDPEVIRRHSEHPALLGAGRADDPVRLVRLGRRGGGRQIGPLHRGLLEYPLHQGSGIGVDGGDRRSHGATLPNQ